MIGKTNAAFVDKEMEYPLLIDSIKGPPKVLGLQV